jgi:ERCC4-type nuclease
MTFLVSPTERELPALLGGITHSLPEKHGADVLSVTEKGKMGVQVKGFPEDLLASLSDGRLTRELSLLRHLELPVLIVKGFNAAAWTSEGNLLSSHGARWTKTAFRNLFRSVWGIFGIAVEHSADTAETVELIKELDTWFRGTHHSLLTRPKRYRDSWGQSSKRDIQRFILQGFPGVASVLSEQILQHFGRLPLSWSCTREELMAVPGIGKMRAEALWEILC